MVKAEINVWVISETLNRMGSSAIEFEDDKAGLTGARLAQPLAACTGVQLRPGLPTYGQYLAVSSAPASLGPLRAQA